MRKIMIAATVLGLAATLMWAQPGFSAAGPEVKRTVLKQQDTPDGKYQNSLVMVEIPVGGREGRHTHPGPLIVHVVEGTLTLEYEGKPTTPYKAGETFVVETGKVHQGINMGTAPIKAIASFVTEKGKPLTTQTE
jgi:quercetin dioxygenase-like cupin family protein